MSTNKKKQLLDPVAVICRLAELYLHNHGTKLAINYNTIKLQGPDDFYIQATKRMIWGDGKEHIFNIFNAIRKIITWYLIPLENTFKLNNSNENNKNDENDENNENNEYIDPQKDKTFNCSEMRIIIKYAIKGLEKLQETYIDGNIVLALQLMINNLKDGLEGKLTIERYPNVIIKNSLNNLLNYKKLRQLWNYTKIKRISELLVLCENVNECDEVSQNMLIESYIKSIDAILNINDMEFQKLVKNTNLS